MVAACFAAGTTTIAAAACEPEVVALGEFLNRCGAEIHGLATPLLRIELVPSVCRELCTTAVIPDRIEAATLMIAAAMTRGSLTLDNVCLGHLAAVIDVLRAMGVSVESAGTTVRIRVAAIAASL